MSKKLPEKSDALAEKPLESIEDLILNIRGKQVMLDRELARLYGVETKVLNQLILFCCQTIADNAELEDIITITPTYTQAELDSMRSYFIKYGGEEA